MAEKKAAEETGNKKKTLIIAIVSLLVLVAVGVGTYLFLSRSEADPAFAAAEATRKEGAAIGPMVDIEAFVINIRDERDSRYLKAAMTLEVDSPKTVPEVIARMPQLRDAILLLVGNKTYDELRDLQGKLQLRTELAVRLNDLLQTGKVKKIYFTDFVVQ